MAKVLKFRILAVAAALALLFVAPVAIAGFWNNSWPIISGASYCAGYSTGTTGQVCVTTVPAGPTVVTGNELIPVDTALSSGQSPQSALMKVLSIGGGATQYSAPLTGTTTTVANTTRQVIIEPAGTIAAHTITLPTAASLTDGQRLGFCTTQIVTALTVTAGSGTTVMNAPTAMLVPVATGAASCVEWIYVTANTKWYRVQ